MQNPIHDPSIPLTRAFFIMTQAGQDFCPVYEEGFLLGIIRKKTIENEIKHHQQYLAPKTVGNYIEHAKESLSVRSKISDIINLFSKDDVNFVVLKHHEPAPKETILTKTTFMRCINAALPTILIRPLTTLDFFNSTIESLLNGMNP